MSELAPTPVTLLLECGAYYSCQGWGDFSAPRGSEIVFCTAMTGIEESLTDPSFAGQLLVNTVAHVGNTGVNHDDMESEKIWAEGLVCRYLDQTPSSWRTKESLKDWIVDQGRYVLEGLDTREITTILRERGSMRALVYSNAAMTVDEARQYLRERVDPMAGRELVSLVTCSEIYEFTEEVGGKDLVGSDSTGEALPYWPMNSKPNRVQDSCTIGVWDFGVKKNTLRILKSCGAKVKVLPAQMKADEIRSQGLDGLLLSNGPGDPAAAEYIYKELRDLICELPILAFCLGHQLVAHALGAKTYKMKFGHRGIHHPVIELSEGGEARRTWITSQNHGFAVDPRSLPEDVFVSFQHADDASVEGLTVKGKDCQTVQFHPEAGPGPYDSMGLIEKFVERVARGAKSNDA